MGDPELRSDENILLRTPGVYVKSIPFEGILTNKRIILVDRATNLLPQKEIPLVTLKDIEAGENAIRDQIIKLSVMTRSGEKRQMILTFSRQAGGNRIKERDAWLKVLKENTASTFDQVIRKVIPGLEQAPRKRERSVSPRIEVKSSPNIQNPPVLGKTPGKKELDGIPPVKKIIEISPPPPSPVPGKKGFETSSLQLGTYCSRCGNRVPDDSGYCNRCGSRIFVPGNRVKSALPPAVVSQPPEREAETNIRLIEKDTGTIEPLIDPAAERIPQQPLWAVQQEPKTPEPVSSPWDAALVEPDEKYVKTDEEPGDSRPTIVDSRNSGLIPPLGKPPVPQRPWEGLSFKPGKKVVLVIIAVIIIVAVIVGGFFIYPLISNAECGSSDNISAHTTVPQIIKNSGAVVIPTKTLKPRTTATTRPVPGNSGSTVGL